jgi:hypothetical protein
MFHIPDPAEKPVRDKAVFEDELVGTAVSKCQTLLLHQILASAAVPQKDRMQLCDRSARRFRRASNII